MLNLAEAIAGANDIEVQIMEFEQLSKAIYTMAKASKFGDAIILRLYCPMAFGNKGAFCLSYEKKS